MTDDILCKYPPYLYTTHNFNNYIIRKYRSNYSNDDKCVHRKNYYSPCEQRFVQQIKTVSLASLAASALLCNSYFFG